MPEHHASRSAGTDAAPCVHPCPGVLHHIHIFSNDLETMIAFWERGFGARLARRRKFGAYDGAVLELGGGVLIYLKTLDCEIPQAADRSGIDHVGVTVPDLDAALAHLLSLPGVSLQTPPFVSMASLCAFIRTDDALVVELLQPLPPDPEREHSGNGGAAPV